jgi:hypothetical protein
MSSPQMMTMLGFLSAAATGSENASSATAANQPHLRNNFFMIFLSVLQH